MQPNYKKAREQALRAAISHCRCVLGENCQTVESHQIARANLAKYRAELATLIGGTA